jgi:hypothetical protein
MQNANGEPERPGRQPSRIVAGPKIADLDGSKVKAAEETYLALAD